MNTPNKITLFRVLLIPLYIVLFYANYNLTAMIVFIIASITDMFDGYIARKYKLVTNFGIIMDPLADKLLVASSFVCLVGAGFVPPWMFIVVLAREFMVSGLRTVAASEGIVIAAGLSGKIKTILQMIAIPMVMVENGTKTLFLPQVFGVDSVIYEFLGITVGQIFLWLSVIMTIVSGLEYIIRNRSVFYS